MLTKSKIRKNDTVQVLAGKDKGKKGKVLSADPKTGKVIVEKVNVAIKHTKPRRQGETGGRLEKETPIYGSKVMRVCPKCGKATRIGRKVLENGQISRYCKNCQEIID